jgi:hypothetical protein
MKINGLSIVARERDIHSADQAGKEFGTEFRMSTTHLSARRSVIMREISSPARASTTMTFILANLF